MPNPTREDTWLVNVRVDGLGNNGDLGTWDTFSGGEADSEESKYSPGGMQPELTLGGKKTVGAVTVSRYLDALRDWAPLVKGLYARAGAARGSVGVTPLAADGTIAGDALTFTGMLKSVKMPDIDSTGSDAAKLELEFTCDGNVS